MGAATTVGLGDGSGVALATAVVASGCSKGWDSRDGFRVYKSVP